LQTAHPGAALAVVDGRVQQRMERMLGAISPSKQATATPRLDPFRSFGG